MEKYKTAVRTFLSEYVRTLRANRHLTQEELAELLRVTSRAYGNLERGVYCFSTVTLIFLLFILDETESREFLQGIRAVIIALEYEEAGWDVYS